MGIDLSTVDYVFISHGHSDHSGGLQYFVARNRKALRVSSLMPEINLRKTSISRYLIRWKPSRQMPTKCFSWTIFSTALAGTSSTAIQPSPSANSKTSSYSILSGIMAYSSPWWTNCCSIPKTSLQRICYIWEYLELLTMQHLIILCYDVSFINGYKTIIPTLIGSPGWYSTTSTKSRWIGFSLGAISLLSAGRISSLMIPSSSSCVPLVASGKAERFHLLEHTFR